MISNNASKKEIKTMKVASRAEGLLLLAQRGGSAAGRTLQGAARTQRGGFGASPQCSHLGYSRRLHRPREDRSQGGDRRIVPDALALRIASVRMLGTCGDYQVAPRTIGRVS